MTNASVSLRWRFHFQGRMKAVISAVVALAVQPFLNAVLRLARVVAS